MNRLTFALAALLFAPTSLLAQQTPFKLGTFEDAGETYLGLVLDDTRVVHLRQGNNAVPGVKPAIPNDMTDLIVQYDSLRDRLYAIANAAAGSDAPYIKNVSDVRILPPIMPNIIYNAASNYSEHAAEMARRTAAGRGGSTPPIEDTPVPDPIPGIWEREAGDTRQNPYIFLKQASTVIA